MENLVNLCTDYLISSTSNETAIGMAELLYMSHDEITRQLSEGTCDSKYLWGKVKPDIQERTMSDEPVLLSFDDSIEEQPYTDENDLICWHWDHVFNRSKKETNFHVALADVRGMLMPNAVEFVKKDQWVTSAHF